MLLETLDDVIAVEDVAATRFENPTVRAPDREDAD
jgi:hypothetical protein